MLDEAKWEHRIDETAITDKVFREKLQLAIKLETLLRRAGVIHPINPAIMFSPETRQDQEALQAYLFLCQKIAVTIAQPSEHALLIQGWLYYYLRRRGKLQQRSRVFAGSTIAIFTAGVFIATGNMVQATAGLLFAGCFFYTFLPLFQPRLASPENLSLSILFVYLFDTFFLLSFLIDPIREVFSRFGTAGNIALALGLLWMTFLAVKLDHPRRVGGGVAFASWMITIGFMGISLLLFPKPVGGRELAAWYLLMVMIFFLSISLQFWFQTALITGNSGAGSFRTILGLILKTRRGVQNFTAIALMLGVVIGYFWLFGVDLMPYALPYSTTLGSAVLLLLFRPPTALVLTHSKHSQLVTTIAETLFPHRILALLDEKSLGSAMFFLTQTDNFRVMSFVDWKEIVHRLEKIVPLVVIDTRIASEPLIFETGYMLDATRRQKAIFLVGHQGEAPALEANLDQIGDSPLLQVTERELSRILYRFLKTGYLTINN